MKILICIKQVPDLEARFTLKEDGTLDESNLVWRMNKYDTYAVEQGLLLKDQGHASSVDVLTVGRQRAQAALRKALEMGADSGVHILDEAEDVATPFEAAKTIAAYAEDKNYDLILCGQQSEDFGNAQVGPMLGEMLSFATVTGVIGFSCEQDRFMLKRELEKGNRCKVAVKSPAVISCQSGLNLPRYPTFLNIMKAKKKPLTTIAADELRNLSAKKDQRFVVPEKSGCLIMGGVVEKLAEDVADILKLRLAVGRGK
ncbi:electron transfer flavoprotein subunit beta/FixA family protein [Desulfovibrio sp. JC010]|uniref:electron transfer flavoprotein subunit beta/FixA family protein n=1 Tax=Desulfovibrio sp. JC010 TaxID=2593641 RepID=UPI0013D80F02|nr:electron transfer flavoprotein subunit beta/FixA family protein [Desulfovibrio sp. JC010]NDV26013.1 electron transfer flavoprotein subunit beta/FixA family protein [Desulfovibrio sp. JC010]